MGENENTLEILEGRGAGILAEVQGPARIRSRKSMALRDGAKWKPYKAISGHSDGAKFLPR